MKCVEKQKLLGVVIDEHLEWTYHVDHVCTSVNSKIVLLNRIKKYLDIDSRKLFYNAYILPIFDYCCTVWGNMSEENILRLEKLQKRAARTILNVPVQTPTNPLFTTLGWLPVRTRFIYHKLVMVYKILHKQTPEYLNNLCLRTMDIYSRNLRSTSTNNLIVPRPNTNMFKKSFTYSAAVEWSSLPSMIKCSNSIVTFKEKCIKHLQIN